MQEGVKTNNKLLIKLIFGSILLFVILIIIIGILFVSDSFNLYRSFFKIVYNIAILIFIAILIGLFMILLSKTDKKFHPFKLKWMRFSFKIFYPIIYITGLLFNIDKDRIRREFAYINNYLVGKEKTIVKPGDILLLLPHCIQWSECSYKISNNIKNCKMCGKCQVKDLINLSTKYGVNISIVTGGTAARNFIKKLKPKAIVAVACERDLTSGINDVKYIPILGIINDRPEGPCFNTRVDLSKVEQSIVYFINGGDISVL